jgi:membrane fusion protein (multidrug efflux system)
MSVRATLHIDTGRIGVVVPRDALLRYPDGRVSVWVVEDGEDSAGQRARERQVELGRAFGDRVEIRAGLAAELPVVAIRLPHSPTGHSPTSFS